MGLSFAQDVWKTVTGAQESTVAAPPLLLAAYAFVWLALIGYVFVLWRRIGRVEKELAAVNSRLAGKRG